MGCEAAGWNRSLPPLNNIECGCGMEVTAVARSGLPAEVPGHNGTRNLQEAPVRGGIGPLRGTLIDTGDVRLCRCCYGTGLESRIGGTADLPPPMDADGVAPPLPHRESLDNTRTADGLLRIGLVNDGKLSAARALFLSGWAKDHELDVCFVSEGALPMKSEPVADDEYQWACPLAQRKGGAGFVLRRRLAAGRKVKLVQGKNLEWSIAVWHAASGLSLVSIYLNPEASRERLIREEFFAKIDVAIATSPSVVLGGDFNACTGSESRRHLSEWASSRGFDLVNGGITTHWLRSTSIGTDLDLLFYRGAVKVKLEAVDSPTAGHLRQIFSLTTSPIPTQEVEIKKIAWKRLADTRVSAQFTSAVAAALCSTTSVNDAIMQVATNTLGHVDTSQRTPLPRRVREKVQRLRKQAKTLARGTAAHAAIVLEVAAILRRFRVRAWQKKVRRLAGDCAVTEETWQLVRQLRRSTPTAQAVGIPDSEIARAYEEVYGSNTTRRSDWISSAAPARSPRSNTQRRANDSRTSLDGAFSPSEVRAALRQLPNGKSPGLDGIPHEAYRCLAGNANVVSALQKEANRALQRGVTEPTTGRLVVIPKKGVPSGPLDMRPLMMLPTGRKFLERMIANRLQVIADANNWDGMHCLQGGFRRGMNIERQLLLAELALIDAQTSGKQLRMVGLDLVKAFDRVPKEFVAHCAANYLRPICPRLADLVVSLTLSPLRAQIGHEEFSVTTGVPQGGILSPWLFVMAMNDLSLRIGDEGYRLSSGTTVGTLLYADDILLLDDTNGVSEERCRLAAGWVAEWGGQVHPGKTQWFNVNSCVSPVPFSPSSPPTAAMNRSIDYLGMSLTPKGVQPKVEPSEMSSVRISIYAATAADALAPAVALQKIRSIAWPKVALGLPIVAPELSKYVREWHSVARRVLCSFNATHGVEIQRELGLLNHPVHWTCMAAVQFFGSIFTTPKDVFLRSVVDATVTDGHPLRQRVEVLLRPSGVTWDELKRVPVADLQRKVTARVREWTRQQLISEATRLGIYSQSDIVWQELEDRPRQYLFEENARYGFCFRRHNLGPSDTEIAPCLFCGTPAGNCGAHLRTCASVRQQLPLPETLQALSEGELDIALQLPIRQAPAQRKAALSYLKSVWDKNVRHFLRAGSPPDTKRYYEHNIHFMSPSASLRPSAPPQPVVVSRRPQGQSNTRTSSRLARRAPQRRRSPSPDEIIVSSSSDDSFVSAEEDSAVDDTDNVSEVASSTPTTFVTGRWTEEETLRLIAAVSEVGLSDHKEQARRVGTRSALQCSDRLRNPGVKSRLTIPASQESSENPGLRKGRWINEELVSLEVAINSLSGHSQPAAIATLVGTRTATQVAAKIRDLIAASRLILQDGSYRIVPQ